MPVQVGLLTETPFAQRTLERFLLVVYVPDVPLQVGRYAEGPFAIVALVRLLARVRPQMSGQVGTAREHFLTEFARVPAGKREQKGNYKTYSRRKLENFTLSKLVIYLSFGLPVVSGNVDDFCCGDLATGGGGGGGGLTTSYVGGGTG